jgi:hypothetical protein
MSGVLWFCVLSCCTSARLTAQSSSPDKRVPVDNVIRSKDGTDNGTSKKEQPSNSLSSPQNGKPSSDNTKNTSIPGPGQPSPQIPPDPIVRYTFWLVVVSALQLVTFVAQAGIVFSTLRATKKSADAAAMSATALIDIERPWVVISKLHDPGLQVPPGNTAPLTFRIELTNQGRTFAKITGVWARFRTVPSILNIPDPREDREMAAEDCPEYGSVLAPDGTALTVSRVLDESRLTPELVADIRARRRVWCLYGLVKYVDATQRLHELQFCYVYSIPDNADPAPIQEGWIRGGPRGYNRHT